MPEENLAIPTPVPVAFLLCEQLIEDSATGKTTIVGVLDRILAERFPASFTVSLYIRMIDCEGEYQYKIEYLHVPTQNKLAEVTGELRHDNRQVYAELTGKFPSLPLLELGEYEFRFWMNNKFISSTRLTAARLETE